MSSYLECKFCGTRGPNLVPGDSLSLGPHGVEHWPCPECYPKRQQSEKRKAIHRRETTTAVGAQEVKRPRRVLVRKGVLTNEEVLEEVKAVRSELEGRRL